MNKITKITLAIILPATLALTGCAVHTTSSDPGAVVATAKPSSPALSYIKAFGDVVTWEDGLSLSVSTATPYTPSDSAAGLVSGQTNLQFTLVLTNHTKDVVKPFGFDDLTSGGTAASSIFDIAGNIGQGPDGSVILPGQSFKWIEGFSVADPKSLTLSYTPDLDHKEVIFTTEG